MTMPEERRSAAGRETFRAYDALHEAPAIVARSGKPTVAKLERRRATFAARVRLLGVALAGGAVLYAFMWLVAAY